LQSHLQRLRTIFGSIFDGITDVLRAQENAPNWHT
jgi:hypothetical protein